METTTNTPEATFFINTIDGQEVPWVTELKASFTESATIIQAEWKKNHCNQYTDFNGLDLALSLNPTEEKPIIITSFFSKEMLLYSKDIRNTNAKAKALFANKYVGFARMPITAEALKNALAEIKEKETDEVALKVYQRDVLAHLKHGLGYIKNPDPSDPGVAEKIAKARQARITGTDQEVIDQIMAFRHDEKGIFSGKFWPGTFCDIEGTLLKGDEINYPLLSSLKEMEQLGQPIHLWTGGSVNELKKILAEKEIYRDIFYKPDFSGAEVETAIDDLPQEKLEEEYNIKVKNYVRAIW